MFVAQFNDFMIWVLFGAVAISAFEGQIPEAIAITAILILNGVLGFVQEYRAEQALEALKQMSAPTATVIRDGARASVPAGELVPGDIVLLEAGDKIPADGRLLETGALRVEEAALTGESAPVRKNDRTSAAIDSALGDRINMVFAGTSVAVGRGTYVVTATGQKTEMGKIAEMLADQNDEQTPLQQELQSGRQAHRASSCWSSPPSSSPKRSGGRSLQPAARCATLSATPIPRDAHGGAARRGLARGRGDP